MPRILEQIVPDPTDLDAQVEFFKTNSYVILPESLYAGRSGRTVARSAPRWTRMGNKS